MKRREPNFENIIKLMRRELTDRPVLFELFMNMKIYEAANNQKPDNNDGLTHAKFVIDAFHRLGYDYATLHASAFSFRLHARHKKQTVSLNDDPIIKNEADFDKFIWPDPDAYDYSILHKVRPFLPDGMKLMIMGPGGVLENVTSLVGYDNLCFMLYENPDLTQRLFDEVGSRLVRYYSNALQYDTVGFISSNDDWGFNTQTFLSTNHMREYVIPWHKKIVETAHAADRPVLLHSCGQISLVINDIIQAGFDAKHSFEDNIFPVEQAYEAWHDRIAILGGIDINFICTRSEEEIAMRTKAMLERVEDRGGWAVGTGNSVADYIPIPKYAAMLTAAIGYNPFSN